MQWLNKMALCLLALTPIFMMPGCASLSEGECKTADWFSIGRQDGNNGRERSRLYDHNKACAEYGVQPNSERYFAGRDAGLQRYCTPRNGFKQGRAGNAYRNVCPVDSEAAFLAEYRQGKEIHKIDEDLEKLEDTIDRRENQLDDPDTTAKQSDQIRKSLRSDYDTLRTLNRELIRLQRLHANGRYRSY